jgi:hypothetical protein
MAARARKEGDYGPIIRYGIALPAVASFMPGMIRKIKGREEPEDPNERAMEDLLMIGSTGAWWDWVRAMSAGPSAVGNWVLGPTASEGMQVLGSDLPAIAKGVYEEGEPNFDPLLKHMVSRTPLVGSWLKNVWWEDAQ